MSDSHAQGRVIQLRRSSKAENSAIAKVPGRSSGDDRNVNVEHQAGYCSNPSPSSAK